MNSPDTADFDIAAIAEWCLPNDYMRVRLDEESPAAQTVLEGVVRMYPSFGVTVRRSTLLADQFKALLLHWYDISKKPHVYVYRAGRLGMLL